MRYLVVALGLLATAAAAAAQSPGGAVVEPLDLPVPTRHLDNVYAILRYTDRPVMARAVSRFRAEDAIRLVAIARGRSLDEMAGEPSVLTSFNVNSPRRVDEELLELRG